MMGGKLKRELTIVEGREPNQYMANEVVRTAEAMGVKANLMKVVDSEKIANGELDDIFSDFVLWRGPVGFKNMYEIERTICWLNNNPRKITINTNVAGGRICTSDKYFQHGLFMQDKLVKKHMLPMFLALSRENVDKLIEDKKIDYPFVLKPDFGTRGEGIVLVKSKEDLDNFKGNYQAFSVEPYIKSTYDWRVFVLGGVALGAMKKIGNESDESDFMAKSGGRQRWGENNKEVLKEITQLAVHAAAISGLEYAGIDLIRDDKTGRFIVLETNIAGGWQNGFKQATGTHVPSKIVEWFIDRSLLFEQPVREAVSTYIKHRLYLLSDEAKKNFNDITSFEFSADIPSEICSVNLSMTDIPLRYRLLSAYALVKNNALSDVDRARLKELIFSLEKNEISRFGNFIGKESGSMEDSIIDTALYLAISSKL